MPIPSLTIEDVIKLIPQVEKVENPLRGGQKQVFPVLINGKGYIVKFIKIKPIYKLDEDNIIESSLIGRLKREIEILKKCDSPNLVKLGDIDINYAKFQDQHLFYFSEEIINGDDIGSLILRKYEFNISEIVKLALDINNAIKELWKYEYIHRDIKPENIIYDKTNNNFVLIDPGVAFDLNGDSFTDAGCAVGTLAFLSPEQLNYLGRRNLDFRSDHFALGVVLYLLTTGNHPFIPPGCSSNQEVIHHIQNLKPTPPIEIRTDIPPLLNSTILRLISKQSHLRYRTCDVLENELKKIII